MDTRAIIQSLTDQARKGFSTPIAVDIRSFTLDASVIVVANVQEALANSKPVRWLERNTAHLRQYDGDYAMSPQEEQQLLLRHHRPRNDSVIVEGTTADDLDVSLTDRFLHKIRSGSTALRDAQDEEILSRLNVVSDSGALTLAGLYALGQYPQHWYPSLEITAAVLPGIDGGDTERASDRLSMTGPLPRMLEDAVTWISRVTSARILFSPEGHGRDAQEFPMVAVRELIANALVHRDLSEPSLSKSIELRLTPQQLVISNPGGLWGLTVAQLGTRDGKSAVNEHLYRLATFTSTPGGNRVIEGLGTGIPAVVRALRRADMEPARFLDTGVRFTALLPRAALLSPGDLDWLAALGTSDLSVAQRHALVEMRHGRTWVNSTYRHRFGLDSEDARRQLQELTARGLVSAQGERGSTVYTLARASSIGSAQRTTPVHTPVEVLGTTRNAAAIWEALGSDGATRSDIARATGLSDRQVSYGLSALVEAGLVAVSGGQGSRWTRYARRS